MTLDKTAPTEPKEYPFQNVLQERRRLIYMLRLARSSANVVDALWLIACILLMVLFFVLASVELKVP